MTPIKEPSRIFLLITAEHFCQYFFCSYGVGLQCRTLQFLPEFKLGPNAVTRHLGYDLRRSGELQIILTSWYCLP